MFFQILDSFDVKDASDNSTTEIVELVPGLTVVVVFGEFLRCGADE